MMGNVEAIGTMGMKGIMGTMGIMGVMLELWELWELRECRMRWVCRAGADIFRVRMLVVQRLSLSLWRFCKLVQFRAG